METIVNTMEENPDRENIMIVWENYTLKDAIIVIEKAVKVIKPEAINYCWRKLCPDIVHDFTGFTTEAIKEIMREIVAMATKVAVKSFNIQILGKFKS